MMRYEIVGGFLVAMLLSLGVIVLSPGTSAADGSTQEVESRVREEFQTHLDRLRDRVDAMEKSLSRIKSDLKRREEKADELIATRVAQLIADGRSKPGPTNTPLIDSASAPLLSAEGWKAWQQQDWRTALQKFELALSKDPKHAASLNGLGWTQFHLGEHEAALTTFEKTLQIDPAASGAANGVGQCLIALGRLEEAETKLTRATEDLIAKHGQGPVVTAGMTASWMGLIQVLLKRQKYEEAGAWCQRYLQHKPGDEMVMAMLRQAEAGGTTTPSR